MEQPFQTLKQALNKAFLKESVSRGGIETLKANLKTLYSHIDLTESETHLRDHLINFLRDTWYKETNLITSKERTDLVIHADKTAKSNAAVLLEIKRPKNVAEMVTTDQLNKKALQELILYYLRERIDHENRAIKTLIITDIHTWFIFEENDFERHVYHNKKLVDYYKHFKEVEKNNDVFYKTISKDFLPDIADKLNFTFFDIRDYKKAAFDDNPDNDHTLIPLYKGLSPVHLLKLPFANDSNSLDKPFYHELLHLIGLVETKDGGKKIITRKEKKDRHPGSLLENAIAMIETEDSLRRLPNARNYGENRDEQTFNVALELVITWMNRLLFLKLLEAQLVGYHQKDASFRFLNFDRIRDFDELHELFFEVLAKTTDSRRADTKEKFANIPYLNSSLFEISDLEHQTIKINSLRDRVMIPFLSTTVLKDPAGRRRTGEIRTLDYIFSFLDAYDFASDGQADIQETPKTIINASVLGLIFEKINGYRDGSFFTPGFITMYMCRETIRRAVVGKMNERFGWNCADLDDVKNHMLDKRAKSDILAANECLNALKICDPAVGSGHFLVSALNELLAIKAELKILADDTGLRLPIEAKVENDELVISHDHEPFQYQLHKGRPGEEVQRIQETLFREKRRIIENCLFGVDINPNSVKICRLRLWIELLKNAFYTPESKFRELETLPNIDINIKQGNSLIARFGLDEEIGSILKKSKLSIGDYREMVRKYHHAEDKDEKYALVQLIENLKNNFKTELHERDPLIKELAKHRGLVINLENQVSLFELSEKEQKTRDAALKTAKTNFEKAEKSIEEVRSNAVFQNAFEWRFEFPEILDQDGRFLGFDCVIGNPPYIRQEELANFKTYFQNHYTTFAGTADLYVYFVERGMQILNQNGLFSYILPNKWMRAGYGDKLRQFVKKQRILGIHDFGDLAVFDEATTYPCVFEMQNAKPTEQFRATLIDSLDFENGMSSYLNEHSFQVNLVGLQDSGWTLSNQVSQNLLDKLRETGNPLDEYLKGKIYYGIKTGYNEAFIIDKSTKENLIKEDSKSSNIIRPFLAGRDIKSYQTPANEKFLILFEKGVSNKYRGEKSAEMWLEESYPAIFNFLIQHEAKAKARSDQGDYWWELRACDYYDEFAKPKLMYQVFQVKPCFAYDELGTFCNNAIWIIPNGSKNLCAFLNSKIGWFLISNYCTAIQNGFQLIYQYFGQIPIPHNLESDKKLETLVNKILAAKKTNAGADTQALEEEIDRVVYGLYGLTGEEIALIEGRKEGK